MEFCRPVVARSGVRFRHDTLQLNHSRDGVAFGGGRDCLHVIHDLQNESSAALVDDSIVSDGVRGKHAMSPTGKKGAARIDCGLVMRHTRMTKPQAPRKKRNFTDAESGSLNFGLFWS
jgi:hypothetical protein